ncbi:GntR family transcriptional regulator [Streptosporangium subroseum]|uniref:GntR family transcriptional regulator n=1 Tax=Streptosporangium subroseum TaxID=106412 RepID=UPI003441D65F
MTRYEIVAHSIRKQVASGSLGRNQQLPGEEALAEQFSVSKGTARQALQMLADEGLVTAVHGKGWFVGNAQTPLTRADEIAHLIREQIISGNIPAGTQLAGENQLAQQYSAARGTVRRAIATLEAEGYLESRRGQGRTVTKRTEPDGSEATTGPAKRLPT